MAKFATPDSAEQRQRKLAAGQAARQTLASGEAPAAPAAVAPAAIPATAPAARPANPAFGSSLLTGGLQQRLGQLSGGNLVGQTNPELQNRINSQQTDLANQFNRQTMPALSRAAEAAGRFGSDAYQMAQGEAATGLARAMGDIGSNMSFQDYNARMQDMLQGLGLQTQMYGMDTQAQSARDNAAAAGAQAAQNASTQLAMQQNDLQFRAAQAAQQGDMDTMNMMLQAAAQMGQGQQNALGNMPNIDNMGGMGFLSNFLGQSGNIDQAAAANALGQGQLGVQQGQLGLANKQFGADLQNQQFNQQLGMLNYQNQSPWQQLDQYGNLVNQMTGQYGTTNSAGHQTTPYGGPSPMSGAISGALGGMSMASGLGNLFGGGGGYQGPPPGYAPQYPR